MVTPLESRPCPESQLTTASRRRLQPRTPLTLSASICAHASVSDFDFAEIAFPPTTHRHTDKTYHPTSSAFLGSSGTQALASWNPYGYHLHRLLHHLLAALRIRILTSELVTVSTAKNQVINIIIIRSLNHRNKHHHHQSPGYHPPLPSLAPTGRMRWPGLDCPQGIVPRRLFPLASVVSRYPGCRGVLRLDRLRP